MLVEVSVRCLATDFLVTVASRKKVTFCSLFWCLTLVALEDLPDDTELFAVPRKFILSIENSNLHNLIAKDQFPPGPWLQLMLTMIYEFLRGERSDWYPYFAILPHHFDTPMFWSETELQELQGSEITNMIGKDAAEESIRQHLLPVMLQNPQHFPGLPADEPAASAAVLELAHRMGSLIKAYAFDIANEDDEDEKAEGEDGYITDEEDGQPPAKGMVPFADLLNANADLNNVCPSTHLGNTMQLADFTRHDSSMKTTTS